VKHAVLVATVVEVDCAAMMGRAASAARKRGMNMVPVTLLVERMDEKAGGEANVAAR
jgi:hypothetical protein